MTLKLAGIIFIVLLYFFIPKSSYASVIFQDDFNSYPNGSFPTRWELFNSSCNANWTVENGEVGIAIHQPSCTTNLIPKVTEWSTLLDEYIYEVDVKFINGTDHNVPYRIIPSSPQIYELHFQSPGDFTVSYISGNINLKVPKSYTNDGIFHHLKIYVKKDNVKVYFDDELVRDIAVTTPPPAGMIGLRAGAGADPNSETWFDNVEVRSIDDVEGLSVPLIKQTDPQWGNEVYDSANLWSSGSTNISSYGCALTSAAMVFQYNGIKKLPSEEDLDPGTLNAWLKSQSDGYVRNGLVNWLALSRLSKLASSQNNVSFDALEYSRVGNQNDAVLASELGENVPPILEEPGHFVVATGTDSANTTFLINDPYYDRSSLADPAYNKSYSSIGIYTPVNSDLSYIMLVVNPDVMVSLFDNDGNSIGNSFIQDPIKDDVSNSTNSVGPLKIFYFKQPSSGKYTLKLTSNKNTSYNLDEYLYDKNADFVKSSFSGDISKKTTDSFIINFDKDDKSKDSFSEINFNYIKNEINGDYNDKKIKKFGTYMSLLAQLKIAQNAHNKTVQNAILNNMVKTIKRDKKIYRNASSQLISDINLLEASL